MEIIVVSCFNKHIVSYKKIIFHTATYSQCDVFGKRTKIQKGISGKGAEIHGVEKKMEELRKRLGEQ